MVWYCKSQFLSIPFGNKPPNLKRKTKHFHPFLSHVIMLEVSGSKSKIQGYKIITVDEDKYYKVKEINGKILCFI